MTPPIRSQADIPHYKDQHHPNLYNLRHLRAIRESRGLALRTVCKDVDMTAATLSRIERGLQGLSIASALMLAGYYKVSVDVILGAEPYRDDSV